MPEQESSGAEVSWADDTVLLFHGTTLPSAQDILMRGVDIQRCKPKRDFGRGFYATTSIRQAKDFAIKKAIASQIHPAVIQLAVDRRRLSRLAALAFVRGDKDAQDYWNFIVNCRSGRSHRLVPPAYYDVVYGPVAVSWDSPLLRFVIANFDQVSFHTDEAQLLLNESPKEMVL